MIQIYRIVNSWFNSNTYILFHPSLEGIWLIDPGDFSQIQNWMTVNKKNDIIGILITHTHFDHIYGINSILREYPNLIINVFEQQSIEALASSKLNGSKYTEFPFSINSDLVSFIDTNNIILWNDLVLQVIKTPGHTFDSVSFKLENFLFTGDALIPNIRTVTKLRSGNREIAKESVLKLYRENSSDTIIMPGHNDCCKMSELSIQFMI